MNLEENLIRRINPLRKCNLPELKEISLCNVFKNLDFNVLQEGESLSEVNCPKLRRIWLNGNKEEVCQVESLSFAAKLESNRLERFLVKCENRIEVHRKNIWLSLENKSEKF